MELFPYKNLNDLVLLCIVEKKNLRKKSSWKEILHSVPYYNKESKREGGNLKEKSRDTLSKDLARGKDRVEHTSHTCTRDIQCFKCLGRDHIMFQCPKRKVMNFKGKDIYSIQDETSSESEDSERENSEYAYPCEGYLLMIQRTMNNHPNHQLESQRENIFHTWCKLVLSLLIVGRVIIVAVLG